MTRGTFHLRHECCREGLEESRCRAHDAREVATNAAAESEQTEEKRDNAKEESDQDKGEHEASQIEVLSRTAVLC